MQLGLALASLGVATSLTAQHMYALTPYAFLSKDFTSKSLNVSISNKGINILGDIFVDNQKLKLNWKQDFTNDENSGIVTFEGFLNDSFLNSFYISDKIILNGKAFLNAKFLMFFKTSKPDLKPYDLYLL